MWQIKEADDRVVRQVADGLNVPQAIARVLVLRGYDSAELAGAFLQSRDDLSWLRTPIETPQLIRAVERIKRAARDNEPMVIYGDYDCDGVTSTSVLYRYLSRGMGANVRAYLPDRFKDGYGVTAAAVRRLAADGIKVILTCDNGISAHAAADAAKEVGIDLVVTDHHHVPDNLPDAYALVHPALEFPHLKDLCGAGVALVFVMALHGQFDERLLYFLDLVTVGTIADVVALNGPNRPLVWEGLKRMQSGKAHPGIKALAEVTRRHLTQLTAMDVAFAFAPRLNAAGRLETPDAGFKLLTTNDWAEALFWARELDTVNRRRQELNTELERDLVEWIDHEHNLEQEPFLVLNRADFHHGITGIVAGKLKERYRVPVLLFSPHEDGIWKGSGRAPEGCHLYDALDSCRDMLLGFGGHAQAAGCSVREEQLPRLREGLNRYLESIQWTRPLDVVWLDAELPFNQVDETFLNQLALLEPFGQKNPAPVFGLRHAKVLESRKDKSNRHLFLRVFDGESVRELKAWNQGERQDELSGWVQVAYRAEWTTFRGQREISFTAERLEPGTPPEAQRIQVADKGLAEVRDRRGDFHFVPDGAVYLHHPEDPRVGIFKQDGVALLFPGDPIPEGVSVALADVPMDLEEWTRLRRQASELVLWWQHHREREVDPDSLTEAYQQLRHLRGVPWRELPWRLDEDLYWANGVLSVLRDAGLVAVEGDQWHLLSPPSEAIDTAVLRAFQRYRETRAFREKLAVDGPAPLTLNAG